jgi:TonB family protein
MKYFFWQSVGIHLLILLCFSIYFIDSAVSIHEPAHIIRAYVSSAENAFTPAKFGVHRKCYKNLDVHPQHDISRGHAYNNSPAKDSKIENMLLKILHDTIASKLVYPDSALLLKKTGTVKIGLTLHPNGQITNISILKTSGLDSMDNAAVSAVQSIPSIEQARIYLVAEKYFSVDVVFA